MTRLPDRKAAESEQSLSEIPLGKILIFLSLMTVNKSIENSTLAGFSSCKRLLRAEERCDIAVSA